MRKKSNVIELEERRNELSQENLRSTKRTRKKKRKINLVNALFVLFVLYFIYTVSKQQIMMKTLDEQIAEKEAEKTELESKAKDLEEDVAKIKDQDVLLDVVEKVARNDYKMVKPNETIYIDRNKVENKFISGIGTEENTDNTADDNEENNESNENNDKQN